MLKKLELTMKKKKVEVKFPCAMHKGIWGECKRCATHS